MIFLPYQKKYINDQSRFKIVEKSRRIGITYAQAYEDVEYSLMQRNRKVWFSSRDDSSAAEYIDYCRFFLEKLFDIAASYIGTEIVDPVKGIQSRLIRLRNGSEIHAMTSSPGRFRSKGGKVILDEFAFHEHQDELYAAAQPAILRGDPIRIISTYRGMNNLYYRLIQKVKNGQLNWSLHSVTLAEAVKQGLFDNIMGRTTSEKEQAEWIAEVRKNCVSDDIWLQEYCCQPVDSATAFITYDLLALNSCDEKEIIRDINEIRAMNEIYIGIDIGRKSDLTAIWITEKTDTCLFVTRRVITLRNMTFSDQKAVIWPLLALPNLRRCCIDSTGLGMQFAEEAQTCFGRYRIEQVTFSGSVKEDMAFRVLTKLQDRRFLIPDTQEIRESFHNIKRVVTAAGNIRFDAERTEAGHSDEFWAAALSLLAADATDNTPLVINSRMPRQTSKWLDKY
jgi:phage FluMu gp28-like protein